ncbi:MAG: hypothetical protein ACETWM_17440 [Candidatus Lokiarchaeia archaeon]
MKKIIGFLIFLSLLVSFANVSRAQVYRRGSPYNMRRPFYYPVVNSYRPPPVTIVQQVVVVRNYIIIQEQRPTNNRVAYTTANANVRRTDPRNFKPPYSGNNGYRTRSDYNRDDSYRVGRMEEEIKHLKMTIEAMEKRREENNILLEKLKKQLIELRAMLVELKSIQPRR